MMKYYRIIPYSKTKDNPYIGYANIEDLGYRGWYFSAIEPITDFDYKIFIKPKEQSGYGNMDDVLQEIMITRPVVSYNIVNMLKSLNVKKLNYIPVNVCCDDGTINKDYYILQILSMFNALDKKNTKVCGTKEHPIYYDEVYDIDRIPNDIDIFVLEDCPVSIIVSERIRKSFIKYKFTGWDFQPLTLSQCGVIIKESKRKLPQKTNNDLHIFSSGLLEKGVLTEIVPSIFEDVSYFVYRDKIILTIENNRRKQRFLMQIKNDENSGELQLICRDVLIYIWEYSKKHYIRKNQFTDIMLDNYSHVHIIFDEYVFENKKYIAAISITKDEITNIGQSEVFNIIEELKKDDIYPFSKFDKCK